MEFEPIFLGAWDFSDGMSLVTTNITYKYNSIFDEDEEILEQSFIDYTGIEIITKYQTINIKGSFESGLAPKYDVYS